MAQSLSSEPAFGNCRGVDAVGVKRKWTELADHTRSQLRPEKGTGTSEPEDELAAEVMEVLANAGRKYSAETQSYHDYKRV